MARILSDWVDSYLKYTDNHEAPEDFHFWTALTIIATILRANVFLDRGRYKLFPNIYSIFISESAATRRSTTQKIGVNTFIRKTANTTVYSDSITPEGVIKSIAKTVKMPNGTTREEATGLIWAPELALMFGGKDSIAVRNAIFLTDVYEGKSIHEHTTAMHGKKTLYNVVLNFLGSAAPDWFRDLPETLVGGGFLGRIFLVGSETRRKTIAWPALSTVEEELELKLLSDLNEIAQLYGEIKPDNECRQFFQTWYEKVAPRMGSLHDQRTKPFIERIHDHALKVAFLLSISESDDLVIHKRHLERGISIIEKIAQGIPELLSQIGQTEFSKLAERVRRKLESTGTAIKYSTLLRFFDRQLTSKQLQEILDELIIRGQAKVERRGSAFWWAFDNKPD